MGPKGSGFALMATDHGVDVLAPYAIDMADLHRLKRSALDPIADRLRGQLKLGSDLFDGEQMLVSHGRLLNPSSPGAYAAGLYVMVSRMSMPSASAMLCRRSRLTPA